VADHIWQGIASTAFIYPAMSGAIRTSILLFYLRIFGKTSARIRWGVYICLVLTAIYVIVFSIIPGIICTPLSESWHPLTRKEHCKSDFFYYRYCVALYSTSLGMDAILLFLPVVPVMKLQMPLRKRMGALVMFLLGAS
jgi:hypothetical protein